MRFAELIQQLGIPPGVFNLVTGYGHDCGDALVQHPDIDAVAFTGSSRVGAKTLSRGLRAAKKAGGGKPKVTRRAASSQGP